MIYWYQKLYMDEKVAKNPGKCKKRVMRRRPWKKSYVAITLAANRDNLFDIIETRQLFFRRYSYLDLYVVGLASEQGKARELLQHIVEDMWSQNADICVDSFFPKSKFTNKIK